MGQAPTGEQWTVRGAGGDQLVVTEVGGGLRSWTRDGTEVLAGFGPDENCLYGRGQVLMPWPNRIRDGRYSFDGVDHQLALTEPTFHNATHGLVRWALWGVRERTEDSITVGYRLHPQPGWPGHLDVSQRYRLGDDGLSVTATAVNVGERPVPFGYGAHPYVSIGASDVSEVELTVPGTTWLEVDERMLPKSWLPVDGTEQDFRHARRVGTTGLDTAYTDLTGENGRWRVRVAPPGRTAYDVWGEAAVFPYLQVFTRKAEPGVAGQHGIAVEPMTCPADAFNSGTAVLRLEPEQEWRGSWGIAPSGT